MAKTALIVDDSRLACKVMAKMLDTFGISSVERYSAEDALVFLQQNLPDIIFLDHTMPGMDGLEMVKILKDTPKTATIPVMMYTAKEGEFYVSQARALGAVEVLPKGLEKIHLAKVLDKFGLTNDVTKEERTLKVKSETIVKKVQEQAKLAKDNVPASVRHQTSVEEKPGWQLFWQRRIEPYLERQKSQQQKESQYNTNLQTTKLTREMHQTLEQFEHALVSRMESHADFVASTEAAARSGRRKLMATLGSLILALQVGIFWSLWDENNINTALLAAQQENSYWQQQTNVRLAELTSKTQQLEMSEESMRLQLEKPDHAIISLVDEHNDLVAELSLTDANKGFYSGVTTNGYQLDVDAQGQIIVQEFERYFLNENCIGDALVNSDSGKIYKEKDNNIWFVDKFTDEISVNINSILTANNECIPLNNELLNLRQLQPNISFETGIDKSQQLKLTNK